MDHAVIAVGYGTENGVDYWKVRNSWSDSWGLNGYILIERGYKGAQGGACGVESDSCYPTFSKSPVPTSTPTPSRSSSSSSNSGSASSGSYWW